MVKEIGTMGKLKGMRDMIACTSTHIYIGPRTNLMVLVQPLHCSTVVETSHRESLVQLWEFLIFICVGHLCDDIVTLLDKIPFYGWLIVW